MLRDLAEMTPADGFQRPGICPESDRILMILYKYVEHLAKSDLRDQRPAILVAAKPTGRLNSAGQAEI